MAKLSARDRKEILRVSKESAGDPGPDALVTRRRTSKAFMSDRSVLAKSDVWFAPSNFEPKGRFHSYGWKLVGRLKEGVTFGSLRDEYRRSGWTIEAESIGVPVYTHTGTRVFE